MNKLDTLTPSLRGKIVVGEREWAMGIQMTPASPNSFDADILHHSIRFAAPSSLRRRSQLR